MQVAMHDHCTSVNALVGIRITPPVQAASDDVSASQVFALVSTVQKAESGKVLHRLQVAVQAIENVIMHSWRGHSKGQGGQGKQ